MKSRVFKYFSFFCETKFLFFLMKRRGAFGGGLQKVKRTRRSGEGRGAITRFEIPITVVRLHIWLQNYFQQSSENMHCEIETLRHSSLHPIDTQTFTTCEPNHRIEKPEFICTSIPCGIVYYSSNHIHPHAYLLTPKKKKQIYNFRTSADT